MTDFSHYSSQLNESSHYGARTVKVILTALALLSGILIPALTIGYYTHHEDEEIKLTFFVKKNPTLQTKFHNIFATEGDDKLLESLRLDERKKVID